jgi:hypothetical protein
MEHKSLALLCPLVVVYSDDHPVRNPFDNCPQLQDEKVKIGKVVGNLSKT